MKKIFPLLIGLLLTPCAFSENLIQVYQQAKQTNPELKSAFAEKEKVYATITGQRASLLPQLGLSASYGIDHGYRDTSGSNKKTKTVGLNLSQSLFDFSEWKNLDIAKRNASVADIAYQAKEQELILNTATAYFTVLKSIDNLSYIDAEKKAIYRQLDQVQQKHKVGLVAITDVQDAQANYDLTIAQQVTALNELNNALESLRQISGRFYPNLATINVNQFKTEKPINITTILQYAENSNLDLLTAKLNRDIAKEQITLAQSGHLPTLSLTASAGLSNVHSYGAKPNKTNDGIAGTGSVGVTFEMPIFSGGAVYSKVEQAQQNYVSLSEKLESTNRTIVNTVRSSYNTILASISSIKAYEQSALSAQSALKATQSGYDVGTRTIVDVLNSTTQLYNAKQKLSDAKYTYLTSLLKMKSAMGTLNSDDLIQLNNMLGEETNTIISVD